MDYDVKKLIITLVIIIVIISIVYVSYRLIMNTPLGRGLNKFLDGVSGVLGGIGAQLETCNTVGYFNVGKGCWTGVLGLGIGIIFGGAWLYSRFKTTSGNKTLDKTAQLAEENPSDVASRITNGLDINKINSLPDNSVNDAAIQKMLARKVANDYNQRVNDAGLNPTEVQELKNMNQVEYNASIAEINEDLTSEQQTESDSTANDIVDPPVFE